MYFFREMKLYVVLHDLNNMDTYQSVLALIVQRLSSLCRYYSCEFVRLFATIKSAGVQAD